MSRLVVPCNGPVPHSRLIVTVLLVVKPATELFPYWSCVLITGWMPNADPAVAFPGCVEKASFETVAGFTRKLLEITEPYPFDVKMRFIFPAFVANNPLKLARPLTVVALVVP